MADRDTPQPWPPWPAWPFTGRPSLPEPKPLDQMTEGEMRKAYGARAGIWDITLEQIRQGCRYDDRYA